MPLHTKVARRNYPGRVRSNTQGVIGSVSVVSPARVTARRTDGFSTLVALDGTCPQRSQAVQSEAIGEVVFTPNTNFQQTGSTGAGSTVFLGGAAWLEKQEPKIMELGEITPVTYFGAGFNEFFTIEYLFPRTYWSDPLVPEVHTGVTVTNLTLVDSMMMTADVDVASDAVWDIDEDGNPLIFGPVNFEFS